MPTNPQFAGWRRGKGDETHTATGDVLEMLVPGEGTATYSRQVHLAQSGDHNSDWGLGAQSHPTLVIHSTTTPTTDYATFAHDGSNLVLTVAGGTGLSAAALRLRGGNVPTTLMTVTTDTTAGNNTWTIAEMFGGLLLRDPAGGARSDVSPTAALIVAGIACATVNDTFETLMINTADGSETVTLTAGTGVTLIPATLAADQNQSLRLVTRLVNVTACSEAVTIYGFMSAGT